MTKSPLKLWIYHRKDGWSTAGIYINAKRRVVATWRSIPCPEVDSLLSACALDTQQSKRKWALAGDPCPELESAMRERGLLEE